MCTTFKSASYLPVSVGGWGEDEVSRINLCRQIIILSTVKPNPIFSITKHTYTDQTRLLIQMSRFAPQHMNRHIVRHQVFSGRSETLFLRLPPLPKHYPLPAMWQNPPSPKSLLIPSDYGLLSHSRVIMERRCGRWIAQGEGWRFLRSTHMEVFFICDGGWELLIIFWSVSLNPGGFWIFFLPYL